jgi:type IV secretory pathway protease TraF
VVLPVPARVQAWQSRWVPLLKPVAAVAGEQVCIEQRWLQIQGTWVGPVLHEAHGMALPQWRGCHIVQEGDVFLASAVPNSLDSRYFGPVPITSLTGQATPLFTWR